jgi:hypothetical protein
MVQCNKKIEHRQNYGTKSGNSGLRDGSLISNTAAAHLASPRGRHTGQILAIQHDHVDMRSGFKSLNRSAAISILKRCCKD